MNNVLALSDFSTNECGDIVLCVFGKDEVSIKKEGHETIVLSLTTFLRMYNKWMDLREEMKRLKENARFCTPFPIPTWRCCESDKPKEEGEYPIRFKNNPKKYSKATFINNNWHDSWGAKIIMDIVSRGNVEWLDEGGE